MTASFKWKNDSYNAGGGSVTSIAVSTGGNTISAGDLLIVVVSVYSATTTDPGAIVQPAGWTQITAGSITGNTWVTSSGAGVRTGLFYRYADGTEGSSFSFSWTNADICSYAILDYTGSTSTPFDGGAETDSTAGFSTTFVAPVITTATNNDIELFIWATNIGGTITMPGGGVNTRVNQVGSNSTVPWIAVADLSIPSAGAQATQTVTYQYSVNEYEAVSLGIVSGAGTAAILQSQACL